MDKPQRPPELLCSPVDGIVVVTRAIPITEQGDCVFVVGTPIDRAALL
jgi:predicted deacylase